MNFITELREGLLISWSAIRANKLRSVLTTLGIIIGVLTVTLMGTAIEGLNNSFLHSISSVGTDVLYIDRYGWLIQSRQEWLAVMNNPSVTLADVEALQKHMTLAAAIAPAAEEDETVKYHKYGSASVPVIGTTEQYQETSHLTVAQGRFLSATECAAGRPVCVIGVQLATNLFRDVSPLGEKVLIARHEYEVVGVLGKIGGLSDSDDWDNSAIIPLDQFLHTIDEWPDYDIQVKAQSVAGLKDTKEELRVILRRFRHIQPGDPDNFAINEQDQFLELFHRVAGTIAAIGLFITGLALFVGGIGIMNIMFVSVAERTREIGVRKALGAKNRTILLQFLIEAACICLLGGVIALLIAWPSTFLLKKAMPASLSPLIVGISLFVSALTGVLSGFFPAWRAARMNPVDALRSE
jgi:putative ABC transport system permease protein